VLEASPHKWYGPHGADDTSDPTHYETLGIVAGRERTEAVIADAVWWGEGFDHVRRSSGYEVGVFTKRRLMEFGAYNPSQRIAQDTLLLRLLKLTGKVSAEGKPTYHRIKRPYSLTTTLETGLRSPARNAVRQHNLKVFYRCKRLRKPEAIRAYRAKLIPPAIRDEMAEHVERLSAQLR
jgi:hypothetical protein